MKDNKTRILEQEPDSFEGEEFIYPPPPVICQDRTVWIIYEDVDTGCEIVVKSSDISEFIIDHKEVSTTGNGEIALIIRHGDDGGFLWIGKQADALDTAKLLRATVIAAIDAAEHDYDGCGSMYLDITMMQKSPIEQRGLLEEVAKMAHAQWSQWTHFMLDHMTLDRVKRWRRLMYTPYNELTEGEKESDRIWAKRYLELILGLSAR